MATFYAKYPATSVTPAGVATVQGEGTPGVPTGGLLTIQGDPSGTPVPVSGTLTATNPSVGVTGAAVPADATYVGMTVAGTLTGLQGTGNGLKVDGSAAIQPVSGTVTANQGSPPWTVIGTGTPGSPSAGVLSVQGEVGMIAVKVDGSGVTQPVSAVSLPLPTGASTAAKQPALGTAGTASADVITVQGITSMTALKVDGSGSTQPVSGTVTANQGGAPWTVTGTGTAGTAAAGVVTVQGIASMTALKVDGSAVTQPVSGTVSAAQSGTWTMQPGNTANTTPWLQTISQGGNSAAVTGANALKVDGSAVTQPVSGTITVNAGAGRSYADSARNVYSSTNVTTGAWVQIIASTAAVINAFTLFDSSGQTLELGTGGVGVETRQLIIPPGGIDGLVPLAIPAATRVSLRAISGTASTGEFDLTGFQ